MNGTLSTNSTLVETVSINCEDFNERFLTCDTCLYMYDDAERTPKLLPCPHTVCLHCLSRIAACQTRDTGTLTCPNCRKLITIPPGGVAALPPNILVNRLLDLMSRQRRHIIPKCSAHNTQELLFCETCDIVFCPLCAGSSNHSSLSEDTKHTIIPYSIAIKRMSEILMFKAKECLSKLKSAQDTVNNELERLEVAKQNSLTSLELSFNQFADMMQSTRAALVRNVDEVCQSKRKVLEEQIALIRQETDEVQRECEDPQYQLDVRNITARISTLVQKLDSVSSLADPRENAFLCVEVNQDVIKKIESCLTGLARVRTTTTFPSLSTLVMKEECVVNLEAVATVYTVDYHGNSRTSGGDPITVELTKEGGSEDLAQAPPSIVDLNNGLYKIKYRPNSCGTFCLKVSVLERPIKNSPIHFQVTEHNNPVNSFGSRGWGKEEFEQPVAVAVDVVNQLVFVLDTGNCRIKVLDFHLAFIRHIEHAALQDKSCTGIAIIQLEEEKEKTSGLLLVNWRTKDVTQLTLDGDTVFSFTHEEFQEPTTVAVDQTYGHIFVADNGPSRVFVFNTLGKLLFQVAKKTSPSGCETFMSSLAVGGGGEIIITDSRIQVFDTKGNFQQEIPRDAKDKGKYGSVAVDEQGLVIASRYEGSRHNMHVFRLSDGALVNSIDSHSARLKRPTGIAIGSEGHCFVIDLGNHCIHKYKYW